MFKRILIALNVLMLVTACAIPISKNHEIYAAMDRYEAAYHQIIPNDPAAEDNIDIMAEVLTMVDRRYVDQVNPEDLIDQAIAGLKESPETGNNEPDPTTRALNAMFTSLDRYTGYMEPTSFATYRDSLDGRFVGFGVHIKMVDDQLTVVSLLKGSSAEDAGIQAGDIITDIDGQPVKGTLTQARSMLRGPEGTVSLLSILRGGNPVPLKINVARRAVELAAVEHQIKGNVGYIRIFSFTAKTGLEVSTALRSFEDTLGSNLCGVILDMRNNPGGLVSAAETVASSVMDGGNIYAVKNRGQNMMARDADRGDITKGAPIVVMLNKGSASSSEIVAGALKYQHRAILFGEQSYGKGLMQSLMPLHNGGGLRLTTGRFTTGGGPTFHGIGLTPDIPDVTAPEESDEIQISRAAESLHCSVPLTTAMATTQ